MTVFAEPMVPALAAAGATLALLVGLWRPAWRRRREVRERIDRLLQERGFTRDLGGGRRRATRRPLAQQRSGRTAALLRVIASLSPWERIRQGRFREQLPDSLTMLASSVRAGHTLLQAFEQLAREAPAPSAAAFATLVREIGLGAPQDEALERLARRYPSEEIDLVVTAVSVQDQVGGSLARVLDSISQTLRERARIAADVSALTAQQRYSAYILAVLPIAVGAVLTLVGPDYMAPLYEPGPLRIGLAVAAGLILVAFLIMRRIAAIDV